MKNPIIKNSSFRALVVSVFMAIFACVADGQQGAGISKAQVQAMLDSIDKACLNKDAAGAVANYASNAVITATVVQNGQTYTNRQSRDEYLHVLEGSLKNTADYSLQHKDVVIEIAPDGRTAKCRFTLIEKWRGNNGGMQEGDTKESLSFSLLDGKLLVTKDHSDVTVMAQAGAPEINPPASSAVHADYSTPMAAAKSYFTAAQAGDASAIRNACIGSSEQKEMTVQFMRGCLAAGKLDAAATARFGRDATVDAFKDDLRRTASMMTDALVALTNCEVKIDGTNATITAKPGVAGSQPDSVKLQKVAGQWKVLLDLDVSKQDFNTDLMEAMATSQEKCAADIKAGLYKTAAEAAQAQMSAMTTQYMQKQKAPAAGQAEKPAGK
jgi:hypothetical protein